MPGQLRAFVLLVSVRAATPLDFPFLPSPGSHAEEAILDLGSAIDSRCNMLLLSSHLAAQMIEVGRWCLVNPLVSFLFTPCIPSYFTSAREADDAPRYHSKRLPQ